MIDKSLERFDRAMDKIRMDFAKDIHDARIEMERNYTRTMITTTSILGSLIVIVGAISTFSHVLFHI